MLETISIFSKEQERFWNKVEKTDSCWNWKGYLSKGGYGLFKINGRPILPHRFIYALLKGTLDSKLTIDHLCKNPACVNPAHLEQITMKENILRGDGIPAINAKKIYCINGHPLFGKNLGYQNGGKRFCRICKHKDGKKWRDKVR